MLNDIRKDAEKKMDKVISGLQTELTKIRTGRANTSLLDHVVVEYYDQSTPLNQVASVTAIDARTLLVTPWDKAAVSAVEKAILNADLGLNPATAGQAIRVPMPPLTEERRKEMIRIARQEAERARVSVRNIRRDANTDIKALLKNKEISVDDERRGNELIQKLTDQYIQDIDTVLEGKEKDLMVI